MLRRVEGWERRLAIFLEERRTMPFAWGPNDCITFGIDAVQAITGVRVREVTWTSAVEAMREIDREGGLERAISSALGTPHDNWRRSRRGDVVLTGSNELAADEGGPVMVCIGAQLVGPGADRMQALPVSMARKVWRVG